MEPQNESKPQEPKPPQAEKTSLKSKIINFYDTQYKILMILPIIFILISTVLVAHRYITTGDLFTKDISLSGGLTITVPVEKQIGIQKLSSELKSELTGKQINVRELSSAGKQIGIIIDANIDANNKEEVNLLISSIEKNLGYSLEDNYSLEFIGSSLGESFFRETMKAVLIAFIAMAVVVAIYFRLLIPSIAVIVAAFGDIVGTLAIVNLMGMQIGTAGIAAFLMLIGYSVDTDMLLTTRVLKRKEGTVLDRILDSVNTGMKMTFTTLIAISIALIFTQSATIRQIMIIILIGLVIDMATTWFMNVGILKLYIEKKKTKNG